jgi:Tfp pilus assembly protein PilO
MPKILPIAIISLLLVLGLVFFWWPKYKEFSDLKVELEGKKTELQNKDTYLSELSQLPEKLKEYDSQLALVDSVLPKDFGTADLLHLLGKEASQNGLVLEKINVENVLPLEKGSEIFKIPVSFSVSGKYPAFKTFIESLQKNARLVEVEYVSFSSPQKGDVFSFDLIIRAHSY